MTVQNTALEDCSYNDHNWDDDRNDVGQDE